jgi:hypothetical protein
MERVSEWLLLAPEGDRQLIVIVLGQLARGVKRVSWKRVRERLDAENSPRGLGMRYSRAIDAHRQALSKQREPRPWAGDDGGRCGPRGGTKAALRGDSRRNFWQFSGCVAVKVRGDGEMKIKGVRHAPPFRAFYGYAGRTRLTGTLPRSESGQAGSMPKRLGGLAPRVQAAPKQVESFYASPPGASSGRGAGATRTMPRPRPGRSRASG